RTLVLHGLVPLAACGQDETSLELIVFDCRVQARRHVRRLAGGISECEAPSRVRWVITATTLDCATRASTARCFTVVGRPLAGPPPIHLATSEFRRPW